MKKKLLALLSLFLALVVFFSPCICSLDKVSAASLSFNFPVSSFNNNVDSVTYQVYFNELKDNPNMLQFEDGSLVVVSFFIVNDELNVFIINPVAQYDTRNSFIGYVFLGDFVSFSCDPSLLDSYNFTVNKYDPDSVSDLSGLFYNTENWGTQGYLMVGGSVIDSSSFNADGFSGSYSALFSFTVDNAFKESFELVNPFFSLDVDDFYTWLVNNDKIAVSGGSGGVSVDGKIPAYIGIQKLKSFLQFYKSYGGSNQSFVKNIVSWFSFMNIVGQTKDNINILKTTVDNLYQEYLDYRSGTHAYWPTATKIQKRHDIDTLTDDDNTTLITDQSSDSVDISLLRDILRGVIAISNNIIQAKSDIIAALERLNFTVNVSNNGGDFQFPNLEDLFVPTYSGFDDLEDQFFEKFPFLLDLQDLPEIEDYLEAQEQGDNLQVAALSAGSEAVEVDPLKTRDDLFRFTVPENNHFMNGAVSGLSIDFASFTKFAPAIEALKGIISVIALFGFSHWLIKFAPKLLHGYASSD